MENPLTHPFLVAAVQATPVFLDRSATTAKACALIAQAGQAGARLVVFPEGFIPTYPLWTWFIPPYKATDLRDLYAELLDNSVTIPGREIDALCQTAARAETCVVMGVNERNAEASGTTLYNTHPCLHRCRRTTPGQAPETGPDGGRAPRSRAG